MDKYIKRDDLLSLITTLRNHRLLDKYGGAEAWKMAKALPTADVEPVRHGRWVRVAWVPDKHEPNGGYWVVRCSECKTPDSRTSDYCPHCGARMDGEA